jgi:hypothetical protein
MEFHNPELVIIFLSMRNNAIQFMAGFLPGRINNIICDKTAMRECNNNGKTLGWMQAALAAAWAEFIHSFRCKRGEKRSESSSRRAMHSSINTNFCHISWFAHKKRTEDGIITE